MHRYKTIRMLVIDKYTNTFYRDFIRWRMAAQEHALEVWKVHILEIHTFVGIVYNLLYFLEQNIVSLRHEVLLSYFYVITTMSFWRNSS